MLLSGQQQHQQQHQQYTCRGAMHSPVRQQSAPNATLKQNGGWCHGPSIAPARPMFPNSFSPSCQQPLSFPAPTFTAGRRIVTSGCPAATAGGRGDVEYTLVSEATGRRWVAVKSVRKCQFGQVRQAVEILKTVTGEWFPAPGPPKYFAIKELEMERMIRMQGRSHEDPLREVAALQYLSRSEHRNVQQCTEALTDNERIYIVTPFCDGGEVFDVVADKGRYHEAEARPLFRQALEGLLFLKQHGVCHRDVSLENLLLHQGNTVKIIDLGLALRVPQTQDGSAVPLPPQGACGKQFYMSPEVLTSSGQFDGFAVDIWACGIMLFVMLTGVPPFEIAMPSQDQRCRVVAVERRLGELLKVWKMSLSRQAVDLMQSCLSFDPACRPTLEELLCHSWVVGAMS